MSARLVRWLAALAVAFAALAAVAWWRSGSNGGGGGGITPPASLAPSTAHSSATGGGGDSEVFDGIYLAYFEASTFQDCTGRLEGLAWLQGTEALVAAVEPFGTPLPGGGPKRYRARIRFRGTLETSPPNGLGFGHLSSYRAQVTVTELLALAPGDTCDVTPAPVK